MLARQVFLLKMVAAIGANIAVSRKQLCIGEAGLELEGVDVGHAFGANNAVDRDDRLLTGARIVAAMKHRHLAAHLPANLLGGVVDDRLLERYPRLG